jgi:hypothetical protein
VHARNCHLQNVCYFFSRTVFWVLEKRNKHNSCQQGVDNREEEVNMLTKDCDPTC